MQPVGLLGVVLSGVMERYYGKGMKDWSSVGWACCLSSLLSWFAAFLF